MEQPRFRLIRNARPFVCDAIFHYCTSNPPGFKVSSRFILIIKLYGVLTVPDFQLNGFEYESLDLTNVIEKSGDC